MISLKWGSTIEEHDQRLRCFVTRERVYLKLGQEIFEVRKIEFNYVEPEWSEARSRKG